jgi:hypothetical protein
MGENGQKLSGDSKLKLTSWFEIDEMEYIEYILKGYTIIVDEDWIEWRLNDQTHRTDGPAVIWSDESQYWYLNSWRHRTDGPAAICGVSAKKGWWLNGKNFTEAEWRNQVAASQLV